jgi:WD40 repeat protein
LTGHTGVVEGLAWSADSKKLATVASASDGTARIWDAETGKPVRILHTPTGGLTAVAWSPTANVLAFGGTTKHVEIHDLDRDKAASRVISSGPIHALSWSPDGKLLAVSGHDRLVRIYLADSLRIWHTLPPAAFPVYHLAWSPDSKVLATNGPDGLVRCWQVEAGELLGSVLPGPGGRDLAVSPEGHYASKEPLDRDLVYVIQRRGAQEVLTAAEIAERFGWQNDPGKVQLR